MAKAQFFVSSGDYTRSENDSSEATIKVKAVCHIPACDDKQKQKKNPTNRQSNKQMDSNNNSRQWIALKSFC